MKKFIMCMLMVLTMLMPKSSLASEEIFLNANTGIEARYVCLDNENKKANSDEFIGGDTWYEDGTYLLPLSAYTSTKGLQENPFGESKTGKLSEKEIEALLKENNIDSMIKAYNKLYQSTIILYKYGYNNYDKWKKVKNMEDPVFGKFNKQSWVRVYENSARVLGKTRLYFDYLGIPEAKYTYKESLEMADVEELRMDEVEIVLP